MGQPGPVLGDSEFVFELQVCEWVERTWPPDRQPTATGGSETPVVVARQLGTRNRRWDTLVVEVDPDGLGDRRKFGDRRLDSDLLHVVRNAPRDWEWYRDALPDPGYPWRYVREAIHEAADRDILDTRRDGNRLLIRRKWPYPDWVERIVAIENKPDLDAAAACALADQLERDVALALADEVWLATEATDSRVEPALLETIPPEAGILTIDRDPPTSGAVLWHPRSLPSDDPGTRILDRPTGNDHDASAARFEYADVEWKTMKRLEIAERAFERGWRSYVDTMRPDCRYFELRRHDSALLPYCTAKDRCQTAGECAGRCPDFQPEPPAWRQHGWPLEGGPGKALKRLLAQRRTRRRP